MVKRRLKEKLSCLGGDGSGDGGGLGGKLLLLLFKLKDIGFSFNVFNLLCISILIVLDVFIITAFATSFFPISGSRKSKFTT